MKTALASMAVVLLFALHPTFSDDSSLLRQLRQNPAESPKAARWFADLPLKQKRIYAAQLGHIVLEAGVGTKQESFVVAFGAEKSPYPWAFIVGGDQLELYGGNSFYYVRRDDKWVKNQWGVWWVVKQNYITQSAATDVRFRKEVGMKGNGVDVWIPAAGWKYVGPQLPKSNWVLGRDRPPNQ